MAIIKLKQLGWFVGLWAASVAVLGIVAFGLRLLLLG